MIEFFIGVVLGFIIGAAVMALANMGSSYSKRETYTPEKKPQTGQYMGKCKCSSFVYDSDNYCPKCGVKLIWEDKPDE